LRQLTGFFVGFGLGECFGTGSFELVFTGGNAVFALLDMFAFTFAFEFLFELDVLVFLLET